jgi:UDP-N-acetylmuramate-alanine ligase
MILSSPQASAARTAARLLAVVGRHHVASLGRAIVGAVAGGEVAKWQPAVHHSGGLSHALFSLAPVQDFGVGELVAKPASKMTGQHVPPRPQILVAAADEASHDLECRDDGLHGLRRERLAEIAEGAWSVLPGDDPHWRRAAQGHGRKVLWYGRGGDCDIAASRVSFSGAVLRFHVAGQAFRVPALCRDRLEDALAAVAVGHLLGMPLAELAQTMAHWTAESPKHRLIQTSRATLIHDEEAVRPAALCQALEMLREFPSAGRRIVCLGEMVQDAAQQPATCQHVARQLVTRCGADVLIACGLGAHELATSARLAGMPADMALACKDTDRAIELLWRELHDQAVVLLAGGPRERMSHIVESLRSGEW